MSAERAKVPGPENRLITRRELLIAAAGSGVVGAFGSLPGALRAATVLPETTRAALLDSDLVYLTPIQSNGRESACHAEIWFAFDGSDVVLCTSSDAWRARAVAEGLSRARLWVGDYGVWTQADGKYREAPELMASGSRVTDEAAIEQGLDLLGDKYILQWVVWGPRFRSGIADGSRVMLRYRLDV